MPSNNPMGYVIDPYEYIYNPSKLTNTERVLGGQAKTSFDEAEERRKKLGSVLQPQQEKAAKEAEGARAGVVKSFEKSYEQYRQDIDKLREAGEFDQEAAIGQARKFASEITNEILGERPKGPDEETQKKMNRRANAAVIAGAVGDAFSALGGRQTNYAESARGVRERNVDRFRQDQSKYDAAYAEVYSRVLGEALATEKMEFEAKANIQGRIMEEGSKLSADERNYAIGVFTEKLQMDNRLAEIVAQTVSGAELAAIDNMDEIGRIRLSAAYQYDIQKARYFLEAEMNRANASLGLAVRNTERLQDGIVAFIPEFSKSAKSLGLEKNYIEIQNLAAKYMMGEDMSDEDQAIINEYTLRLHTSMETEETISNLENLARIQGALAATVDAPLNTLGTPQPYTPSQKIALSMSSKILSSAPKGSKSWDMAMTQLESVYKAMGLDLALSGEDPEDVRKLMEGVEEELEAVRQEEQDILDARLSIDRMFNFYHEGQSAPSFSSGSGLTGFRRDPSASAKPKKKTNVPIYKDEDQSTPSFSSGSGLTGFRRDPSTAPKKEINMSIYKDETSPLVVIMSNAAEVLKTKGVDITPERLVESARQLAVLGATTPQAKKRLPYFLEELEADGIKFATSYLRSRGPK